MPSFTCPRTDLLRNPKGKDDIKKDNNMTPIILYKVQGRRNRICESAHVPHRQALQTEIIEHSKVAGSVGALS